MGLRNRSDPIVLFRDRGHKRAVDLGPYPLESLARDANLVEGEGIEAPTAPGVQQSDSPIEISPLAQVANGYQSLFEGCSNSEPAPASETTSDLAIRTAEIKGAAYYLDASHCGVCRIPTTAWKVAVNEHAHSYSIVIWVEFGRDVEVNNLAHEWVKDAKWQIAHMRATEIGVSIAGHIRALGFAAELHTGNRPNIDLNRLGVLAGLGQRQGTEVVSPFFGNRYAAVAVSTDYQLNTDLPLAKMAKLNRLAYWWGNNGSVSGRERNRQAKRPSHFSRYPMERVRRVERPTTLILENEIPRVPKRAEFFTRARNGDLGGKAQKEVQRFAFKHPLTNGMMYPLRAMVPHQDGEPASLPNPSLEDPVRNTEAIKSLSYHLGADLTGICEIPDYAWYSHDAQGNEIPTYHKYAVVMLIDQGYDTMEGASGDDWISGCQSMRGYIRGAEIAGVMAQFLRQQGVSARSQTNADSHVLQIPLVLLAGLGELSRIGELVLNPYVGPRFKSVVLTTNLPLIADKPIDFGLQTFCSNCFKCARECPVNAIPFGDKVMYNGYEIWKPDVERCTRYRVTNPKGSACGRCMKTCPLNKVVSTDGALVHRVGTWLGIHAQWLKPILVPIAVYLDDKLGYGMRNPIKRWWQNLEIVDGVAKQPKGTNERDLDLAKDIETTAKKSPVGYYHASDMPPPQSKEPVPANHKHAIGRADVLETVEQARQRYEAGDAKPLHYSPAHQIPIETIE